jgi:hypothetical protein
LIAISDHNHDTSAFLINNNSLLTYNITELVFIEEEKSLKRKEAVNIPDDINQLFIKNPYEKIFDEADAEQEEAHKPILQVKNKNREISESEKRAKIEEGRQKINEAKTMAQQIRIECYEKDFNENAEDDIVTLAEMELNDLEDESKKAAELKRLKRLQEEFQRKKQFNELHQLKADLKDELVHKGEIMKKKIERIERESIDNYNVKELKMKRSFKDTTRALGGYLVDIKTEVGYKYKDLSIKNKEDITQLLTEGEFFRGQSWKKEAQIVSIKLKLARCVKDKIPKGRYAILCSILDRIGGNSIDSKEASNWKRVSTPRLHSGEHYLNNLRFETSVILTAPSWNKSSPSMVYLFELFLLKSREYTYDQVLGWGVFPVVNADFNLNLGKFKVPLLFGPVDHTMDKYRDIEEKYKGSIDNWLCNLYFSIKRKSKEKIVKNVTKVKNSRFSRSRVGRKVLSEDSDEHEELKSKEDINNKELNNSKIVKSDNLIEHKESFKSAPNKKGSLYTPNAYDEYTFNVHHIDLKSGALVLHKLYYVVNEALSDFGFYSLSSLNFWISFIILIAILWIRFYIHTFGSWIFLKMTGTGINAFDSTLY